MPSDWYYFVPYQSDINRALQALRRQVFERGRYHRPAAFYAHMLTLQPEVGPERVASAIRTLWAAPPRTMDELIERNGEAGTHSIIDIEQVWDQPGFGVAWPLTPDQLLDVFGTTEPTRDQVLLHERSGILGAYRQRWQALYIVVYCGGLPSEIFFRGYSGA
jgi:hypothetical protein